MWVLCIIISVIVVLYLYKYIENCKKREERRILQEKMQREEKNRRQTELREKARKQNIYWSYLPNIYDKHSKETLRKSLEILKEIKWYHSMAASEIGDFNNPSSDFDFNVWTQYHSEADELQKQVAKMLGSPLWKIDSTGGEQWINYPCWEELDIKYLSSLL